MKHFILLLSILSLATPSFAANNGKNDGITPEAAQMVSEGWTRTIKLPNQKWGKIQQVQQITNQTGQVLYSIISLKPAGFIILANDKRIDPVIAFSASGRFVADKNNPLMQLVSRDLTERYKFFATSTNTIPLSKQWSSLEFQATNSAATNQPSGLPALNPTLQYGLQYGGGGGGGASNNAPTDIRVNPFMQSEWGQLWDNNGNNCYNNNTPRHYPAGCVATAMGQLMRYYQYPTGPIGSQNYTITVDGVLNSYYLTGGNGSGGAYDWGNMPLITDTVAPSQATAIGRLLADAGATVNMNYTVSGSGSDMTLAARALTQVFQYTESICAPSPQTANLPVMINPNLDARMPVLLGIQGPIGHAVVVDGYGYLNGALYHHLNMGWNGDQDIWYALPVIPTIANGTFTNITQCIYNTFPYGAGEIISGRILDINGNPIAGATVTGYTGNRTQTATTDTNGIYALPNASSSASYSLVASGVGYFTKTNSCTTGFSASGAGGNACGNIWGGPANFTLLQAPNLAFSQPVQISTNNLGGSTAISPSTPAYANWTAINNGNSPISNGWTATISLDGTNAGSLTCPLTLNPGDTWSYSGLSLSNLVTGAHTVTVQLDAGNVVTESSKQDNTATTTIYSSATDLPLPNVSPASGVYNLGQSFNVFVYAPTVAYIKLNTNAWSRFANQIQLPAGSNNVSVYNQLYDRTSQTTNVTYTILVPPTLNPAASTYATNQTVQIINPASNPTNSQIYISQDGGSFTLGTSLTLADTASLGTNHTVQAYISYGGVNTPITSGQYSQVAGLTASPSGGAIGINQPITLMTATNQQIYYAVNSGSFQLYTKPVYLTAGNNSITAYPTLNNVSGLPQTFTYTSIGTANITPASGTNNAAIAVSISGQNLYYSTNQSTYVPYTGIIPLDGSPNANGVIQVSAYAANPATTVTNTYVFAVKAPTITPSQIFYNSLNVNATATSPNTSLYYAINTNAPTADQVTNLYTQPIVLDSSAQIAIIAKKTGYQDSPIVTGNYIISTPNTNGTSQIPIITPASGTILGDPNTQTYIHMTITAGSGATLSASINNNPVQTINNVFSVPLGTYHITVYSQEPGKLVSEQSVDYQAKFPQPKVTLNSDTSLTITSIYPGTFNIYDPNTNAIGYVTNYTLNGVQTMQTVQLTLPGNYNIAESTTNWVTSDLTSELLGQSTAPTIAPDSQTFNNFSPINVTITPNQNGDQIYTSINALGGASSLTLCTNHNFTLPAGDYTIVAMAKNAYQVASAYTVKNYHSTYFDQLNNQMGSATNSNPTTINPSNPGVEVSPTGSNGGTSNQLYTAVNPPGNGTYPYQPTVLNSNSVVNLDHPVWLNAYQPYFISLTGVAGNYTFQGQVRTIPANDNFTNATIIDLSNPTAKYSTELFLNGTGGQSPTTPELQEYTLYASMETNEPASAGQGHTIWFKLTTPLPGQVTATYDNTYANIFTAWTSSGYQGVPVSMGTPEMSIWSGTNLDTLTYIGNNVSYTFGISQFNYYNTVTATVYTNEPYYLRIDGLTGPGEFGLRMAFSPIPANDNIASATTLTGQPTSYDNGEILAYAATGENYNATAEAGEDISHNNSVWYVIYPSVPGYLTVNSATENADGSTAATNTVLPLLYLNTDTSTNVVSVQNLTNILTGTLVAAGTPVYICVSGSQCQFGITATLTEPPANDFSTNALVNYPNATGAKYSIYNFYATATEPTETGIPAPYSIWWSMVSSNQGTIVILSSTNFPATYWSLYQNGAKQTPQARYANEALYATPGAITNLFDMLQQNQDIGTLQIAAFDTQNNATPDTAIPILPTSTINYDNGIVYAYRQTVINNTYDGQAWYSCIAPTNVIEAATLSSVNSSLQILDNNFSVLSNPTEVKANQRTYLEIYSNLDLSSMTVDLRNIPSNDEPTNATPLQLGGSYSFYTKYATMTYADGTGVDDIWCLYDPVQAAISTNVDGSLSTNSTAMTSDVDFYIDPAANGHTIIAQFYQAGTMVQQTTIGAINWPSIPFSTKGQPVLIRLIAQDTDTDISVQIQPQSLNDNFANAYTLQLKPSTMQIMGVNLVAYTANVIANNQNASLEANEVDSTILNYHDVTPLNNRSLWFKVTTPVSGTFSLNSQNSPSGIHFELETHAGLMTDISQSVAWNALTMQNHQYPSSQIVSFYADAGQTYYIRADTAQVDYGQNMQFTVAQIPIPQNSGLHYQTTIPGSIVNSPVYYLGKYPSANLVATFDTLGTLYGANRTYPLGTEDFESGQLMHLSQLVSPELLTLMPEYQEVWYQFTPSQTIVLNTLMHANFSPLIYIGTQPPAQGTGTLLPYLGGPKTFFGGTTYYFCIDGLAIPSMTYSGNEAYYQMDQPFGQYLDLPVDPPGIQGLNTDANADCLHSWPNVFELQLANVDTPQNDSILAPRNLELAIGHVGGTCQDPNGSYMALTAQNNQFATAETNSLYTTADNFGGANKTVWWTVSAIVNGTLNIDTTDSQVPAIIKVFPNMDYSTGYRYTGTASISVTAGELLLIGLDSAAGTNGWLAMTVSQSSGTPINDMFANAELITTPTICGNLNNSTVETGENLTGTGSIWYKLVNYASTSQSYSLSLAGNGALMDMLYSPTSSLTNSLTKVAGVTNFTYIATAGEIDYIRVFSTNAPASGQIQLAFTSSDAWKQALIEITPSTVFSGSMTVEVNDLAGSHPQIFYDPAIATTQSQPYTQPINLTSTASYDFLIVPNGQPAYHVSRTYIDQDEFAITPSCAFTNSMVVSANEANFSLLYRQGSDDGSAPNSNQAWLNFPTNGIALTTSAEVDIILSGGLTTALWNEHYTNTVAAPTLVSQGTNLTIQTTTPKSTITVNAGTNTTTYATNFVQFPLQYPTITATATRTGWLPSSTTYTIASQTLNTNLETIQISTNSWSNTSATFTLSKTNASAAIAYTISHQGTPVNSGITYSNTVNLTLTFNATIDAYESANNAIGPDSQVTYTAKLQTPLFTSNPSGTLTISNPNTLPSSLVVNGVNVGTAPTFTLPLLAGALTTAYAASDWAANSDPTNYLPALNTALTLTPASGTYNNDFNAVASTVNQNSYITVTVANNQQVNSYSGVQHVIVPVTAGSTVTAIAQQYGTTYATVSNNYTMQISPLTVTKPPVANGFYDAATPVLLQTATPGCSYFYQIDNDTTWYPAPNGLFTLATQLHSYNVEATRTGWLPATQHFTIDSELVGGSLVNYVSPYYTIFPGTPSIPAEITATNSSLIDSYPVMYIHHVWFANGTPSDAVYVANPVNNLLVYHQVIATNWNTHVATYGPVQASYVTVTFFDWQSTQAGTIVSSDPTIYTNVFFYQPTWISSWTPMDLQAVTPAVAYDLSPLRNPSNANEFLIPGNLNTGTRLITLRYRPTGSSQAWKQFAMQFKTEIPSVSISTNDPGNAVVSIDPSYLAQNADVRVYYSSTGGDPTKPFANEVALTNGVGIIPLSTLSSTNWLLNSKYYLHNLSNIFTNGINALQPVPLQ